MNSPKLEPVILELGERSPRPPLENPGAITEFLGTSGNLLEISFEDLQPLEIASLRHGDVYVGLMLNGEHINFIWEFNQHGNLKRIPVLTLEGHFDVRLIEDLEPERLEHTPGEHLVFGLVATDFNTHIIKTLRYMTLPKQMTQDFMEAVNKQLKGEYIEPNTSIPVALWKELQPNELSQRITMVRAGQEEP